MKKLHLSMTFNSDTEKDGEEFLGKLKNLIFPQEKNKSPAGIIEITSDTEIIFCHVERVSLNYSKIPNYTKVSIDLVPIS